jgi:hypothetical protein
MHAGLTLRIASAGLLRAILCCAAQEARLAFVDCPAALLVGFNPLLLGTGSWGRPGVR